MEKYSENVDFNFDDVPVVEKKLNKFDQYRGKKVKIAKLEIKKETNFYPDGNNYDANSKELCYKLYIYSEPLKMLDDDGNFTDEVLTLKQEDGTEKEITIHARFGLNTGIDGKPEISKHPKAKLWAVMRKLGAQTLSQLIGKTVLLDLEPSKIEGDDRKYLRLVL